MAGISASELQNRTRGQALCGWYAEAQQLASALVCAFRSLEAGATVAFLTTQLAEAAALSTWRHVADCIGDTGKDLKSSRQAVLAEPHYPSMRHSWCVVSRGR